MATEKKRVQGYLSDIAYQYLEDYRLENGLRSQSLALEQLLESLAVKGSSSDLESESYSKLKSELKSELLSELTDRLTEIFNLTIEKGENYPSDTQKDLENGLPDNLPIIEYLETVTEEETRDTTKIRVQNKEGYEAIAGLYCLATIQEGIAYFWDAKGKTEEQSIATIYQSKPTANSSLSRLKKTRDIYLNVWECHELCSYLSGISLEKAITVLYRALSQKLEKS